MPAAPDRPTDDEPDPLVTAAMQGDPSALEQLLRELTPQLTKSVRIEPRWNRSLSVDDVLQVTYLEAFLRIKTLQKATRQSFAAWLKRIADNNLIDAVRGLERKKRPDANHRITQGPAGQSSRTLLLAVAGDQQTAGGQAAMAEQVENLHRAIARLPKSYREVVQSYELDERPIEEIAENLGRSTAAVYMLRSRALDRLRELLAPDRNPEDAR